jgi:hypothetical protein
MQHLRLVNIHWSFQTTLLRFLLAKIVWEGYDTLTVEEEFLLIETFDLLDSNTNYDYVRHHRRYLIKVSPIIHYYINCKARTFKGAQIVFEKKAKLLLDHGILPTAHAYFGWVKLFNVKRYVRGVLPGQRRNKRIKRFIGVGYKDKGTMKNLAFDGSPSWQEVAACELKLPPQSKNYDFTYRLYLTNWGWRKVPDG